MDLMCKRVFNGLYSADYEMLPNYPLIPIWIVIYPSNVPPETEIVTSYGWDIATQQYRHINGTVENQAEDWNNEVD
jgi:hypothetical protein